LFTLLWHQLACQLPLDMLKTLHLPLSAAAVVCCTITQMLHHLQACPASCLVKNKRNQSPIDVAAAGGRGEVLNALLLACAGEGSSTVAVAAMRALLAAGAVPDTWAPNGSSALMLAAAANGVAALKVGGSGGWYALLT
jgi:hypothetical protein